MVAVSVLRKKRPAGFELKVSVSAGVCWLWGFWGKRGAAEQGRTGLGQTG